MAANDTEYTTYLALIADAKAAAAAYYETAEEIMSDSEYDTLIDTIEKLEHKHGWNEAGDILTAVAGGVNAGDGDVKHDHPMLSLGKVSALEEITAFVKSMGLKTGSTVDVVLEPKLDGLAISAKYADGKLVQIVTRGDGIQGEDITARVLAASVKGLPKEISRKGLLEVRGEVFITKTDFITASMNRVKFELAKWAEKNAYAPLTKEQALALVSYVKSERRDAEPVLEGKVNFHPSKHIFANSRNAVSGSLRRETVDYVVPMTFAVYDSFIEGAGAVNHRKQQQYIGSLGFTSATDLIPEEIHNLGLVEAVEKFGEIRAEQEYPTDGVVIKADSAAVRKKLGAGSKNPRWAVAYKYPAMLSETVVKDIEMNIGRTGRLTLRAKVTPVLVDGTLINYASLHNVSWLEEKDIRIGDTVTIKRANDVIPYIAEAVLDKRPTTAVKWEAPETCFQCNKPWDKTTLLWRCESDECGQLNTIIHAAGRDYFDWEGLSEAIITRLNDMGLVNDIADVFTLSKEALETLDMGRVNKEGEAIVLGEKVATKLHKKIQDSKARPLNSVLASLGVRTLGRSVGRWLVDTYPNMDAILKASPTSLARIEGIGQVKARLIYEGLTSKRELIQKLGVVGVNMTSPVKVAVPEPRAAAGAGGITGQRICVTGSVPGYTRTQVGDLIRRHGGVVSSSVSGQTDLLVADANSGTNSKYREAVRRGIRIVSPEAFLQLIR